jgi:hypothetical protein
MAMPVPLTSPPNRGVVARNRPPRPGRSPTPDRRSLLLTQAQRQISRHLRTIIVRSHLADGTLSGRRLFSRRSTPSPRRSGPLRRRRLRLGEASADLGSSGTSANAVTARKKLRRSIVLLLQLCVPQRHHRFSARRVQPTAPASIRKRIRPPGIPPL